MLGHFNPVLKMIFTNMASANKSLQVGSAMALTKIIQNAPVEGLQVTLSYLTGKILECM
jgi:hypothetical protein